MCVRQPNVEHKCRKFDTKPYYKCKDNQREPLFWDVACICPNCVKIKTTSKESHGQKAKQQHYSSNMGPKEKHQGYPSSCTIAIECN
jgi:hypothetical protein